MGLLKHVLFWPVTGPMFLTEFAFDKVQGVVREELTDDTRIKSDLMELQLMLELGDIDDDEYIVREAALMLQLRDIRHWREEFGMGVSGGPVRVQQEDRETPDVPAADEVVTDDEARAETAQQEATGELKAPKVVDASGGAIIDVNFDWE